MARPPAMSGHFPPDPTHRERLGIRVVSDRNLATRDVLILLGALRELHAVAALLGAGRVRAALGASRFGRQRYSRVAELQVAAARPGSLEIVLSLNVDPTTVANPFALMVAAAMASATGFFLAAEAYQRFRKRAAEAESAEALTDATRALSAEIIRGAKAEADLREELLRQARASAGERTDAERAVGRAHRTRKVRRGSADGAMAEVIVDVLVAQVARVEKKNIILSASERARLERKIVRILQFIRGLSTLDVSIGEGRNQFPAPSQVPARLVGEDPRRSP